jgi:hypothetical protein
MDDLISRKAAINESYQIVIDGETYDVVQVETLMGLPAVQPEVTEKDVVDYCYKRELCIVDKELLKKYESAPHDMIRCRDCKHSVQLYCTDVVLCKLWRNRGVYVYDESFCSFAERRK